MNIDKKIFYLTFEIISIGAIIFLSNMLWWTFDYENESNIAYAYSNYQELLLVEKEKDGQTELSITNESNIDRRYKLYIKTNHEEYLESINTEGFTIGNYTYYLIYEGIINSKTTEKKIINLTSNDITFKIEEI